jgi:hypothetical protein
MESNFSAGRISSNQKHVAISYMGAERVTANSFIEVRMSLRKPACGWLALEEFWWQFRLCFLVFLTRLGRAFSFFGGVEDSIGMAEAMP